MAQVIVASTRTIVRWSGRVGFIPSGMESPLPSTLDDWVGGAAQVLQPVAMQILQQIVSGSHISLDDTPVRVLIPRPPTASSAVGHIWSLVGQGAVAYLYTPSWSGKPIRELLSEFEGLPANDGYAGLQKLFENRDKAPRRAGCMAHAAAFCPSSGSRGGTRRRPADSDQSCTKSSGALRKMAWMRRSAKSASRPIHVR